MRRRDLMLSLGAALTAARGIHAQQKTMRVIGYLGSASPGPNAPIRGTAVSGSSACTK